MNKKTEYTECLAEIFYYQGNKSKGIRGGFGIRFNDKDGNTRQNVDLSEQNIKYFIPFEGIEKRCWHCGNDRELLFVTDFEGNLVRYDDLCNTPMVVC